MNSPLAIETRLPCTFDEYRFLQKSLRLSSNNISQISECLHYIINLPITTYPERVGAILKIKHNSEFTEEFFSVMCLMLVSAGFTSSNVNIAESRLDTSHLSNAMLNDLILHPGINIKGHIIGESDHYFGYLTRRTFNGPVSE